LETVCCARPQISPEKKKQHHILNIERIVFIEHRLHGVLMKIFHLFKNSNKSKVCFVITGAVKWQHIHICNGILLQIYLPNVWNISSG